MPGSTAVVDFVASNPAGIGYSGIGYKNEKVKCLAITGAGGKAFAPTNENIRSGAYPLRRPLYVYQGDVDNPEILQFLKWIKSPAGQKIVAAQGFTTIR